MAWGLDQESHRKTCFGTEMCKASLLQSMELDFAGRVLFNGILPKYNVLVPGNGESRDLLVATFLFGEK